MNIFSLILGTIAFSCFTALGIIAYIHQRENRQELRVTPFSAEVSWILVFNSIIGALDNIIRAVTG